MRAELRWQLSEDHTYRFPRGVVLVSESKEESELLDQAFGSKVIDGDGLIDSRERKVECRLSDGYADHYVYIDLLAATEKGATDKEKP